MPASPEPASLPRWAEQLPAPVTQSGVALVLTLSAIDSGAPLILRSFWGLFLLRCQDPLELPVLFTLNGCKRSL